MSSAEYSCKLFKPIFAYRQTEWTQIRLLLKEQSDLGPHCLKNDLKSQADDKADDNSCDWHFKGENEPSYKAVPVYMQMHRFRSSGSAFVAQWVACVTGDLEVVSLIPTWSGSILS